MSDLRELYQEVIIDHNRSPRNFHTMENPTHLAEGYNPLCGDQLILYLEVKNDRVSSASFVGKGCAISTASASLLTESVIGKTLAEVDQLFNSFHEAMMDKASHHTPDTLPIKLQVLLGAREYPARVKCATLAWHALHSALHQQGTASTE